MNVMLTRIVQSASAECVGMEGRSMKISSVARTIGVVAFALYSAASWAVDLPVPSEAEIAAVSQKLLDGGCNSYALTPPAYSACIHRRAKELPPLDLSKREHFGEQYDPTRYLECMKASYRNYQGCDRYELRRVDNPEYWPYPEVQGIKWPDPPKESVYRSGMSSKDYFEALCKAEAGEFIYRTVEGVEGIYEIRPSRRATDREWEDRYVLEDPWNASSSRWRTFNDGDEYLSSFGGQFVQPHVGKYQFAETPIRGEKRNGPKIVRVYRDQSTASGKTITSGLNGQLVQVPYVLAWKTTEPASADYGFTWRGIQRPHDREMNIAGSELAIVNLRTNETIALKREFVRTGESRNTPRGVNWETAASCSWPRIELPGMFIRNVLKPILN